MLITLQFKDVEMTEENIVEIITQVGLLEKRKTKAKTLSGGMKRKLQIAISLVGSPSLVLLDEPTAGIDASSRHEVWSLIQTVKLKSTVLLTTHYMEEADIL